MKIEIMSIRRTITGVEIVARIDKVDINDDDIPMFDNLCLGEYELDYHVKAQEDVKSLET